MADRTRSASDRTKRSRRRSMAPSRLESRMGYRHEGEDEQKDEGDESSFSSSSNESGSGSEGASSSTDDGRSWHKGSKRSKLIDNVPGLRYRKDKAEMIKEFTEWREKVRVYITTHSLDDKAAAIGVIAALPDEGKRALRELGFRGVAALDSLALKLVSRDGYDKAHHNGQDWPPRFKDARELRAARKTGLHPLVDTIFHHLTEKFFDGRDEVLLQGRTRARNLIRALQVPKGAGTDMVDPNYIIDSIVQAYDDFEKAYGELLEASYSAETSVEYYGLMHELFRAYCKAEGKKGAIVACDSFNKYKRAVRDAWDEYEETPTYMLMRATMSGRSTAGRGDDGYTYYRHRS